MKKVFIFWGFCLLFGIPILILFKSMDRKDSNNYFRNLNLFLTGIVKDKQLIANDAGLLYVDIKNTSIPEYDTRSNGKDYYCIIHKGKAEILEGGLFEIHIGDSIVIDSKIDSFKCYRNGKFVLEKWLFISHFIPYTAGVKKYHRM